MKGGSRNAQYMIESRLFEGPDLVSEIMETRQFSDRYTKLVITLKIPEKNPRRLKTAPAFLPKETETRNV
jgi:hypothetical protein